RIEDRHLPEHVSLAEADQLLVALVDLHLALDDQVERVAGLALREDLVAQGERLLLGDLRDLRQLLGGERPEQIDRLEEQHFLHRGDHALALGDSRASRGRAAIWTEGAGSGGSRAPRAARSAGER